MAIVVKSDGDKSVANISQRDLIGRKFDGMQVTVNDASDDPLIGNGRALYQWSSETSSWDLVWAEEYGASAFASDKAAIESRLTALENSQGTPQASVVGVSGLLDLDQVNSTTTPQTLNNHTFIIPPQKTLELSGRLIATTAATTTGVYYGVLVQQGAGANASATGSWYCHVNIVATAAATGLSDGDVISVNGGGSYSGGVLGTGSSGATTPVGGFITVGIKNHSTNANTTVSLQFRSEVANRDATARSGTCASGVII